MTSPDTLKALAAEFNRYFTSSNGIDVGERVSVPRDEWRKLFAILESLASADEGVPVVAVHSNYRGSCQYYSVPFDAAMDTSGCVITELVKRSDHLAALSAQSTAADRWISVDERLPELNTEVLVAFKGIPIASTGQYTGSPHDVAGWCYPSENNGCCDDGTDPVVIAWMPLPDAALAAHEAKHGGKG